MYQIRLTSLFSVKCIKSNVDVNVKHMQVYWIGLLAMKNTNSLNKVIFQVQIICDNLGQDIEEEYLLKYCKNFRIFSV